MEVWLMILDGFISATGTANSVTACKPKPSSLPIELLKNYVWLLRKSYKVQGILSRFVICHQEALRIIFTF